MSDKPEPVAFVNLERWLAGNDWPDDCFSKVKIGDLEQPLYGPDLMEAYEKAEAECAALLKAAKVLSKYPNAVTFFGTQAWEPFVNALAAFEEKNT